MGGNLKYFSDFGFFNFDPKYFDLVNGIYFVCIVHVWSLYYSSKVYFSISSFIVVYPHFKWE